MLQRKNLLLVEDDAIVLSALCELLLASDEYYITKRTSETGRSTASSRGQRRQRLTEQT